MGILQDREPTEEELDIIIEQYKVRAHIMGAVEKLVNNPAIRKAFSDLMEIIRDNYGFFQTWEPWRQTGIMHFKTGEGLEQWYRGLGERLVRVPPELPDHKESLVQWIAEQGNKIIAVPPKFIDHVKSALNAIINRVAGLGYDDKDEWTIFCILAQLFGFNLHGVKFGPSEYKKCREKVERMFKLCSPRSSADLREWPNDGSRYFTPNHRDAAWWNDYVETPPRD